MIKPVRAWHFVGDTLRNGRPVPADGVKLIHGKIPSICNHGFHASKDPFDALNYAPGKTLCLVEMSGYKDYQFDKMVASERVILHRIDATELLRKFSCRCALDVIHLWKAPKVVVDYLTTGDESLRAAAWEAAREAAGAAAGAAAWEAARAAREAAWEAAGAAAGAAAWEAAWAAAGAAAGAAREAAREAAGAAAGAAAWAAAWAAQRKNFNDLVNSEFSAFLNNLD